MKEIWEEILGYEGLYQVSNCGNVKSLSRTITKGNITYVTKDKLLKQSIDTVGYPYVNLSDYKKQKTFRVHQLVAIAFLNHTPNKYDGLLVDHIDGDKLNNHLSNLQLVTNRKNSSKDKKNKTSKFTGVSWHKQSNKWLAQVRKNNKVEYLGVFEKEEEAAIAYLNSLQAERSYSEEDVKKAFEQGEANMYISQNTDSEDSILTLKSDLNINEWFKKFKNK
jgi:hypothetical protein